MTALEYLQQILDRTTEGAHFDGEKALSLLFGEKAVARFSEFDRKLWIERLPKAIELVNTTNGTVPPGNPHIQYKCRCHRTGCQFCDGGLYACTNCGLFEGSLTTECCGRECYAELADLVYQGHLDFRGGRWVLGDGHMPWKNNKLQCQ